MSEDTANALPLPEGLPERATREPLWSSVTSSVHYLRESAHVEGTKRRADLIAAALLPVSSLLLVIAISIVAPPSVKTVAFFVPVLALAYYLALRVGIVKTMNRRQAYLTWHMLIGTFLLGGAFALFVCYVCTCMINIATRGI